MTRPRFVSVKSLGCAVLAALPSLAISAEVPANPAAPSMNIAICDDDNEWPPASYYVRKNGVKTRAIAGFALEVLDEIFVRHDIKYTVDLISWPRCVALSTIGERFQMVLNFSYNPERLKNYYFSRAYYATTAYYYYSRKNNPDGLKISKPADLKRYRICGVQGFNYSGYGLAAKDVDQGAKDFTALISKLKLNRCALFVEKDEVIMSYEKIGMHFASDPDLAKAQIPGLPLKRFYFGISRKFPRSAELHALIDDELLRMEEDGRLGALWKKALTIKEAR